MTTDLPYSSHLYQLTERHPALKELAEPIQQAVDAICDCVRSGGKLLICGNGGSAADAEHIVGELMKNFAIPRPLPEADKQQLLNVTSPAQQDPDWPALVNKLQRSIPAIALSAHTSLTTAIANDADPRLIFAQQIYGYARPGDIVWAISTSGNSTNVVYALRTAQALGLKVIGLTGAKPSAMDTLSTILIKAPSKEVPIIQEYHLPIYHTICLMVEAVLFG